MKVAGWTASICILATACTHTQNRPISVRTSTLGQAPASAASLDSSISEFAIIREPPMSYHPRYPRYTLICRADGSAIWQGWKPGHGGSFRLSLRREEFARLAKTVADEHYFDLGNYYGAPMRDVGSVTISIVKDGRRKTVLEWGVGSDADVETGREPKDEWHSRAPKSLRQIQRRIDALSDAATWTQAEPMDLPVQFRPGLDNQLVDVISVILSQHVPSFHFRVTDRWHSPGYETSKVTFLRGPRDAKPHTAIRQATLRYDIQDRWPPSMIYQASASEAKLDDSSFKGAVACALALDNSNAMLFPSEISIVKQPSGVSVRLDISLPKSHKLVVATYDRRSGSVTVR